MSIILIKVFSNKFHAYNFTSLKSTKPYTNPVSSNLKGLKSQSFVDALNPNCNSNPYDTHKKRGNDQ